MSEYVVDASALVSAMSQGGATAAAVRTLLRDSGTHAPHLVDAETGQALRGLERRGEITEAEAQTALGGARLLVDERYDHRPLAEAAWRLRHTVTFYDGLYVALANRLRLPLLTGDVKLANAPGITCQIELLR